LKAYEFFDKPPKFGRLVVIEGTERELAERSLALVIERLLDPTERDLNLDRFTASECGSFDGVAGALASLPFLGSRRVVVVRGAHELRADPRRALIKVAENAPEGNVLVIEDLVSPASKRPEPLAKALGRAALRIDCSPGADARARFVHETLAVLGASAAPAAIAALMESDGDFAALRTDLEKLALGGATIALEDVMREVLVTEDVRAYQYASAAVAGRAADALALAHELFSSDPRGAAVPLLAALAAEYGLVWEVAREGGALPARAKWRERELRTVARALGERRARGGFELAVRGFEAVVTGRADDPRIIVESATAAATQGHAGTRRETQNR
jgi:DNA polymerase III delta subunit